MFGHNFWGEFCHLNLHFLNSNKISYLFKTHYGLLQLQVKQNSDLRIVVWVHLGTKNRNPLETVQTLKLVLQINAT